MKIFWLLMFLLMTTALSACGGGGGGSSSPSSSGYTWPTGNTPLIVGASSYANKNDPQLVRTQLEKFDPNVNPITLTFGDFFQDGQFSAFIVVNQTSGAGKAYFLRWNTTTSAWVDDTDRILGTTQRAACVSNQYAITADFNGDGKPDVYLSCAMTQAQPVDQLVFLSQPDGSYLRQNSGVVVDGKSASAIDLNNDGKLDLIVSNSTSNTRGEPQVYFGNGTGAFAFQTRNTVLVAQDTQALCGGGSVPTSTNSVNIVPSTNGRFDLIIGATGSANSIMWLKDLGSGAIPRYSVCNTSSLNFPNLTSPATLTDVYSSINNGVTTFYLGRKSSPDSMTISKFTLSETTVGLSTTYSLNSGTQPVTITAPTLNGLPDLFKVNAAGLFQAFDAGCSSQTTRCSSLSAALSSIN